MKLTKNTKNSAGMTLIEVTLVIAVLLGLISVLFIGVKAYKRGSDRAKCILNVSTLQKAVRSYQNLYELEEGDALVHSTTLIGSGKMMEVLPACPEALNAYVWLAVVPATGTPYLDCDDVNADHSPSTVAGW